MSGRIATLANPTAFECHYLVRGGRSVWSGTHLSKSHYCPTQLSGDVLGGGTAFPHHNVVSFPSAGALIFWTNLTPEGEIDYRSVHGGCPTIRGVKWGEGGTEILCTIER